jgi:Fe-S cluster biogenesis protein NfuA
MAVTITLEFTPNPDTLKYAVSEPLLERGALDFPQREAAGDSPLALYLFQVDGVAAVMIGRDFVTVTVPDATKMASVNTEMLDRLKQHLDNGQPIFTGELPGSDHGSATDPISKQIVEILDAQIRPAVAMDGGDIVFDRFEEGVVYLHLKGSCAGCPSSTVTLKMGIESRLREEIPEVLGVEAIA